MPRNVLPQIQKMIPEQLKRVMRAMFIKMGGSNPLAIDHGVMNLPTPYPQRFLLLTAAIRGLVHEDRTFVGNLHCDCNKDRACHGLVAVDSIGAGD